MTHKFLHIVSEQDHGVRLDRWLLQQHPNIPRSRVFRAIRQGQIRINGKKGKPDQRLQAGEVIQILGLSEDQEKSLPQTLSLTQKDIKWFQAHILAEEKDFVVLNKPYGLATQGGTDVLKSIDSYLPLLDCYLKLSDSDKTERFCRLVHRLDRDTSGVLLVAKNRAMATQLGDLFQKGEIQKTYLAVVWGKILQSQGIIKKPLVINEKQMSAETHYEVLNRGGLEGKYVTLLKLIPQTGRKHQLRRHCHGKGFPIVGDQKYDLPAYRPQNKEKLLHLHAWRINLMEKSGNVFLFEAPLPLHMEKTFEDLGWKVP